MKTVFQLIEDNGLTLHGDIEHFAELVLDAERERTREPLEYWNAVEGWVKIDEVREHFDSVGCGTIYKTAGEGREPLYTAPLQREWVGLTEVEINHIFAANVGYPERMMNEVAKLLKEKNHE